MELDGTNIGPGAGVDGKEEAKRCARFLEGPAYTPLGVNGLGVESPLMGDGVRE